MKTKQVASEAGVGWSDARKLSSRWKWRWVDKQKEMTDTEQKRRLTGGRKKRKKENRNENKEEQRAVKDLANGEWRNGERKSRLAAECRRRPSV